MQRRTNDGQAANGRRMTAVLGLQPNPFEQQCGLGCPNTCTQSAYFETQARGKKLCAAIHVWHKYLGVHTMQVVCSTRHVSWV